MKKPRHSMPKEVNALNLRHNFGEILDKVANKRERFLVKRAGIPAAIILSVPDYEDLEDLIDTYYEQRDPAFQRSLAKARQDIKDGKTATLSDLHRDLKVKEARALNLGGKIFVTYEIGHYLQLYVTIHRPEQNRQYSPKIPQMGVFFAYIDPSGSIFYPLVVERQRLVDTPLVLCLC